MPSPEGGAELRIAIFGGVSAWRDGVEVDLGGPKPRLALAMLALALPRSVDTDSLIDGLWDEQLPTDPRRDLRTIVSRLRSALGAAYIVSVPAGGYRLTADRAQIDVDLLERALARADRPAPRHEPVVALRAALAATSGRALGSAMSTITAHAIARSLEELRAAAEDRLATLLCERGMSADAIVLLEQLVTRTPLDEDRWASLMRALASAGRRGEALRCYQRARQALVADLGVEPGPRLQAVEAALLREDAPSLHELTERDGGTGVGRRSTVSVPETRYAEVDGLAVAYQVWGDGPLDVVVIPPIVSHLEAMLDLPGYRDWMEGLAAFSRVVVFDKRGNGMSDRMSGAPSLGERISDIAAVMDANDLERAALLGISEGSSMALLFAALHPARVSRVVVAGGMAVGRLGAGRMSEEELATALARIREGWGRGDDWWLYELAAPSLAGAPPEVRRRYERLSRMSSTPHGAAALWDMYVRIDVRAELPNVRCPVLVQHRAEEPLASWAPAIILDAVPTARQSLIPGADHMIWASDVAAYLAPIREFLLA